MAPAGERSIACPLCQRVTLSPAGIDCPGTCRRDKRELFLAADGTVTQQLPEAMEQLNDFVGGNSCTWQWWPAALR